MCFLSATFGTRNARKPIKGSKDSDYSLVSKTNWAKRLARWFCARSRLFRPKCVNAYLL